MKKKPDLFRSKIVVLVVAMVLLLPVATSISSTKMRDNSNEIQNDVENVVQRNNQNDILNLGENEIDKYPLDEHFSYPGERAKSLSLTSFPYLGIENKKVDISMKKTFIHSLRKTVGKEKNSLTKILFPHRPIHIDGNDDFTGPFGILPNIFNGVIWGRGTRFCPYIIARWEINASNTTGIQIENTSAYFIIKNCYIHDCNKSGIFFQNVTNGNIKNCCCCENQGGIYFDDSSNNKISNCNFYNNDGDGIYLYHSSDNVVSGCEIAGNGRDGVYLEDLSNNNEISGCEIAGNERDGIYLEFSEYNNISGCEIAGNGDDGITLGSSSNNSISVCGIAENGEDGIHLYDSSYNEISDCNITGNGEDGIKLWDSSNDNLIHHNNFIDNDRNAYDKDSNQWDDDSEGNYWDNYTGEDADGDGIGDTPYDIPGGDNQDRYPLMEPCN